jgi:anthranilate phosphoribosyltransferase
MEQLQSFFNHNELALIHQPDHFPLAENLIPYRDQIGKRPPLASMELIWTCHQGDHLHISGYVHSPTEERHWKTLELLGEQSVITIKGLEGGIDLSISRSSTIGQYKNQRGTRTVFHTQNYECLGQDIEWNSIEEWKRFALQACNGEGPLTKSLEWNAGIYFFLSFLSSDITELVKQISSILRCCSIQYLVLSIHSFGYEKLF